VGENDIADMIILLALVRWLVGKCRLGQVGYSQPGFICSVTIRKCPRSFLRQIVTGVRNAIQSSRRDGDDRLCDDIVDVAKTMVGLEERFVDLAFGHGTIEGMRPWGVGRRRW
jgi:hypothetical protein